MLADLHYLFLVFDPRATALDGADLFAELARHPLSAKSGHSMRVREFATQVVTEHPEFCDPKVGGVGMRGADHPGESDIFFAYLPLPDGGDLRRYLVELAEHHGLATFDPNVEFGQGR